MDELQQKYFVGVRYQNVTKLCPPFGRCIGAKRFMWVRQSSPLSYLHILLICLCNTSCLEPGQDNVYTIFLKENVCSGYSLVAALSNVNDSFTLTQCPTVTLEERSKRRNFGRITPNFGLFQWIRRHFWCLTDGRWKLSLFKSIRIRSSNMKSSLSGSTCIILTAKSSTET